MSRFSRFDKLESERKPAPDEKSQAPGATLDRFGGAPTAKPPSAEVAAQAPAAPLERFEADGVGVLRTNDDELTRLPYLECPACGAHAGKYEQTCANCSTRLDSREARAHNLARLEALRQERAEAKAREVARREAEIAQAAELRAEQRAVVEGRLRDIKKQYAEPPNELARYLGVWVAIVICAVLAMELHGLARVLFGLVALVLALSRLPPGAWRVLGHRVGRR